MRFDSHVRRTSRALQRRRLPQSTRRGMATLEVVMTTAVMFPAVAGLVFAGFRVCKIFFSVVGAMVGSPYL